MLNENLTPFNSVSNKTWNKYKKTEDKYNLISKTLFEELTIGHTSDVKQVFEDVLEWEGLAERDKAVVQNFYERYQLTGEIPTADFLYVKDKYELHMCEILSKAFDDEQ